MVQTLTPDQARRFYNRLGKLQDTQAFYEDKAVAIAIEEGRMAEATSILEFGCGTGRHALNLLEGAPGVRYLGIDLSDRMVELATARVREHERAEVRQSEGSVRVDVESESFDRFFSTYVLDLLSEADIREVFNEAARVLRPGGLLCLVSLSEAPGLASRALCGLWNRVHAISPTLVGGCRPLHLLPFLDEERFDIRHHETITALAVPSEILIAARR